MSPAHVLEPTYAAIKQRLMAGAWPCGFRIEAARLAELLGVSITPVRDSLNRLAGERMVEFVAGEGFRVPRLAEVDLRDLFGLNRILLLASLGRAAISSREGGGAGDIADRVGRLFLDFAQCPGNGELAAAVGALNDRLHLARTFEARIFADAEEELAALEAMVTERRPRRILLDKLVRYHGRRERAAEIYARLLGAVEGDGAI